jgi:hypothetical protein
MGNALAVAGQAAANQVFSSAFWVVSVLPSGKSISSRKWRKKINKSPGKRVIQLDLSRAFIFTTFTQLLNFIAFIPVTATLVSKANAKGNQEDVQDAVSQALIVGFYMSLVGTALMMLYPEKV